MSNWFLAGQDGLKWDAVCADAAHNKHVQSPFPVQPIRKLLHPIQLSRLPCLVLSLSHCTVVWSFKLGCTYWGWLQISCSRNRNKTTVDPVPHEDLIAASFLDFKQFLSVYVCEFVDLFLSEYDFQFVLDVFLCRGSVSEFWRYCWPAGQLSWRVPIDVLLSWRHTG